MSDCLSLTNHPFLKHITKVAVRKGVKEQGCHTLQHRSYTLPSSCFSKKRILIKYFRFTFPIITVFSDLFWLLSHLDPESREARSSKPQAASLKLDSVSYKNSTRGFSAAWSPCLPALCPLLPGHKYYLLCSGLHTVFQFLLASKN